MNSYVELNEVEIKRHGDYGAELLKSFHREYEKDPQAAATEFRRGQVTGWRHLLDFIYGERITDANVNSARNVSGYSVPPAGMMDDDGKSYLGWDSGADRFIGKIAP
jgi:hypothetical protein